MPRARSRRCPICLVNHPLDVGKICPDCDSEMRAWALPPDVDGDLDAELDDIDFEFGGTATPDPNEADEPDDKPESGLSAVRKRIKSDSRDRAARDIEIEAQLTKFRRELEDATADDFRDEL